MIKLKAKENNKYIINVSAIVGVGIATTIIGGGIGGFFYSGLIRIVGAAVAAGTTGATGTVLITNSIENNQAANPDRFGFLYLLKILSEKYSGASLIDDSTNQNNIQTLEIEEFKDKDSIDKCMNNSLE